MTCQSPETSNHQLKLTIPPTLFKYCTWEPTVERRLDPCPAEMSMSELLSYVSKTYEFPNTFSPKDLHCTSALLPLPIFLDGASKVGLS
jgi:hypothetical protein